MGPDANGEQDRDFRVETFNFLPPQNRLPYQHEPVNAAAQSKTGRQQILCTPLGRLNLCRFAPTPRRFEFKRDGKSAGWPAAGRIETCW